MSGVVEGNERVRAYLDELEIALRVLPPAQASELTEQITAHLEEALLASSADETVVAALGRLGSPAKLAAEAQTAARFDEAAPEAVRSQTLRTHMRHRFGPRGWGAIAAGVAAICVLSTWLGLYIATPNLAFAGSSAWLSAQDEALSVDSSTLGATASTVPARRGQWQGFVMEVENPSNSAQTILGAASPSDSPTALVGMAGVTDVTVAVSTYANYTGASAGFQSLPFTARQTIEPGQFRFIRVMWKTDPCSLSPGAVLTGSDQLDLEVRVGWFAREEDLPLDPGWQLLFGSECSS